MLVSPSVTRTIAAPRPDSMGRRASSRSTPLGWDGTAGMSRWVYKKADLSRASGGGVSIRPGRGRTLTRRRSCDAGLREQPGCQNPGLEESSDLHRFLGAGPWDAVQAAVPRTSG